MTHPARDEVVAEIIGEFSHLFASARTRWTRYAEEIHPDLRGPGMMLLQTILRQGPITATALGGILDMDKAMVSRQVTKLRALGLVDAREAETDRRVILLTASQEAQTALDSMHARTSNDYRLRFHEWSDEELGQLHTLLHRFNVSSNELSEHSPARRCAREEARNDRNDRASNAHSGSESSDRDTGESA
ncbi:MarR family transcriptional regulator [Leucobacter sp. UT-8R-CII-1-4]|uniref:MarR family winged helix-turn-helix transcriptional regulator n=1 Tax=Leucobacter sp. UT-8R-CII-1-4 TaxID=3040075 RepID=UPI0024A9D1DD|nr:MarR family transcriptional regulator [Leucobacter sp. UT-8R-CII-1-4]MDI6023730.1 MarR family transcriptional regulator [Leucobacter sp. UT-8R-CII-1-4]